MTPISQDNTYHRDACNTDYLSDVDKSNEEENSDDADEEFSSESEQSDIEAQVLIITTLYITANFISLFLAPSTFPLSLTLHNNLNHYYIIMSYV